MLRTAGLLILLCTAGCTDPGDPPYTAAPSAAPSAPAFSHLPSASPTTEPSWPQLRGPTYNATSPEIGLAERWPADGPPVLWLRDLGQGYSSFAGDSRRLFTQTQSVLSQSVVCLDAETGATRWEHRYDLPYEPAGLYPGPRATPTLHNGRVYFAAPSGQVGCLDAASGKPIWSVDVNETFGGRGTDFGYSASPVVEDGKVILPVGGRGASIVALDAYDGSTVWATGNEPASYCSILPITLSGQRLLVAFLQNSLAILDLHSGEWFWHHSYSQGYDEHSAAPLYSEPCLFIASPFRSGSKLYRLAWEESPDWPEAAQPPATARLVVNTEWESPTMSNDVASSVLVDGYIYGFDLRDVQAKVHRPSRGTFRCMDLRSGAIQWSSDEPGHCTIIAADGKLILFNDRGQVLLIRATPDEYRELARTDVFGEEICWTSPALASRRLYLRTHSRAACLYLGDPEELTVSQRGTAIPAAQVPKTPANRWMFLLGKEREFLFDPPTPAQLGRWFLACLAAAFVPAALASCLVQTLWRRPSAPHVRHAWEKRAFWLLAVSGGILATPLANRAFDEYYFTWPVVPLAALHVAVAASIDLSTFGSRLRARVWGLALLAVCFTYFAACRRLSLHHEWAFLMGLLPAFPLCAWSARRMSRHSAIRLGDLAIVLAAFSIYYWSAAAWMTAKRLFAW